MIGLYVLGVLPSLGQTLIETHAHRQTQTAYTAVLYAAHGIDLLRPSVPVLGPPGFLPQEFPIFQAVGALLIDAGAPPDPAMRVVGLASFVLCAVLLYLLARRVVSPAASLVVLAAFLFNAHAWVYGRTALIEYLANAGAIGYLLFAIRWLEGRRLRHWFLAVAAATVGMLVKITTMGFLLFPILLWRSQARGWAWRRPSMWAAIAIALAIGFAWSGYAEGVREETPAAVFLSFRNQLSWFFGTPGQRLDLASWRIPLVGMIGLTGFGLLAWGPLAVAGARRAAQPAFLLALLALIPGVPLVLFNLYAVHDYYLAAIAPLVALAIGVGVDWLRAHWHRAWTRRVGVALAGAWVATIIGTFGSWSIIYGTPGEERSVMTIARFVRDHSEPDDWVVLQGWGWNTTFFYYARRQGLALPEPNPAFAGRDVGQQDLSEIDLDALLASPVFGPFMTCDHEAVCRLDDR
jgi:4-amino-4-deoxy-L-arabinose transferase-like glycosyltransferase